MDVRRSSSPSISIQNQTSSPANPEQSTTNNPDRTNRQALENVISKAKTPKNPFKKIPTRLKQQSEKTYLLSGQNASPSDAPKSRLRSPLGYELNDARLLGTGPEATEDHPELLSNTGFAEHHAASNLPRGGRKVDPFKKANAPHKPRLTNIVNRRAKVVSDLPHSSPIQETPSHGPVVGADQVQQLTNDSEKSAEQNKSDKNDSLTSSSRSSSDTEGPGHLFRTADPQNVEAKRSWLLSHLNRDLVRLKEQRLDNEAMELQGGIDDLTAVMNSYMEDGHIPLSPSIKTGPQSSARSLKGSDSSDEERRIAGEKKRLAYKAKAFGLNDGTKISATAQTAKENLAKMNPYLRYLPAGATLNPNGTFGGTYISHLFPENTIHVDWEKVIEVEFAKRGNNLINHKNLPPKQVGGVRVINASEADFPRAKYQIPHRDGRPHIDGRFKDGAVVAKALREFTGNDSATVVLSSLMIQETPGSFFFAMQNQSGADLFPYLRILTPGQAREINRKLKSQLKTEGMVANFKLSRSGEDYKITVTLDVLLEQPRVQLLPMRVEHPMEAHFEAEIIVNAEAARKEVLELKMPGGVKCEFKGRLDPSLVK